MNKSQIAALNDNAYLDVNDLIKDLEKKRNTPFVNSVIVAKGLRETIYQISNGMDKAHNTHKLTPLQREIFVWAYLEAVTGFIEHSLVSHTMPEAINVPK